MPSRSSDRSARSICARGGWLSRAPLRKARPSGRAVFDQSAAAGRRSRWGAGSADCQRGHSTGSAPREAHAEAGGSLRPADRSDRQLIANTTRLPPPFVSGLTTRSRRCGKSRRRLGRHRWVPMRHPEGSGTPVDSLDVCLVEAGPGCGRPSTPAFWAALGVPASPEQRGRSSG